MFFVSHKIGAVQCAFCVRNAVVFLILIFDRSIDKADRWNNSNQVTAWTLKSTAGGLAARQRRLTQSGIISAKDLSIGWLKISINFYFFGGPTFGFVRSCYPPYAKWLWPFLRALNHKKGKTPSAAAGNRRKYEIFVNRDDARIKLDKYRDFYNNKRPHYALDLDTPAKHYQPSNIRMGIQ